MTKRLVSMCVLGAVVLLGCSSANDGSVVVTNDGSAVAIPGASPTLRAVGWAHVGSIWPSALRLGRGIRVLETVSVFKQQDLTAV